jgi:chaperonin GroES
MLRELSKTLSLNKDLWQAPNLTERFTPADLEALGGWVWSGYDRDKQSRAKWETRMEAAMDLAMQVQIDKNFPWPNCSNVVFPLITIAALQFSSRSYANIVQGLDVVKYRTVGQDPGPQLIDRATRVSKHMSWQVLEEDKGWEEQHDRLLINLGIVGCNFVKSYYSSTCRCSIAELVIARDLVIHYNAKSVETAPRKTQIIELSRNEIYERCVSDVFDKNILNSEWFNTVPGQPDDAARQGSDNRKGLDPPPPDEDTPFRFYEQHRYLDLDKDGYQEPYICTIEAQTKKVVRLTARFERDEDVDWTDMPGTTKRVRSIKPTEYYTKYGFIPSPDGSIYDVGFGTLIGPLNEAVNSGINQLIDSGTQYNSNGGFLGRGVKVRGGVYTQAPWTWKRVDCTGDDLRKGVFPFPIREPSTVMFQLLGLLIEYTDRLAGTVDQQVGVAPGQNTPAETSRNTMEAGMNAYKGIFKRVWRSMKEEFKKKHILNSLFLPTRQRFGNEAAFIFQEDYRSDPELVVPAADPNLVSDSQRLQQATAMLEASHTVPGFSIEECVRNWLRALRVDSIDKYYPGPDKVPPLPNPKMMVEQAKIQIEQMKLQSRKWEVTIQLQAAQQKTQAEIVKLYAEISKLLAETQTEKVKAKVEAFSAMVDAFKTHSEMMSQQIEVLRGESTGDENGGAAGGSKPGDVGALAAPPGNTGGAAGVPAQVNGITQGSMGG